MSEMFMNILGGVFGVAMFILLVMFLYDSWREGKELKKDFKRLIEIIENIANNLGGKQ